MAESERDTADPRRAPAPKGRTPQPAAEGRADDQALETAVRAVIHLSWAAGALLLLPPLAVLALYHLWAFAAAVAVLVAAFAVAVVLLERRTEG